MCGLDALAGAHWPLEELDIGHNDFSAAAAGPALAAKRREELLHLSEERALAASEALLSLVTTVTLNPGRVGWSGLIEQQALFHRRPSP